MNGSVTNRQLYQLVRNWLRDVRARGPAGGNLSGIPALYVGDGRSIQPLRARRKLRRIT